MHKGRGTEEHGANTFGPAGYWAAGRGRQGGGRRAGNGGSQKEEGTLVWENPWG